MSQLIENKERRTVDVIGDHHSALVDSRRDGRRLRLTRDICNNEMGNIKSTAQHILCGYRNGLSPHNTIEKDEHDPLNIENSSNNSLSQPTLEKSCSANHNHYQAIPTAIIRTRNSVQIPTDNRISIATPESDDELALDHEQSDCEQASDIERDGDESYYEENEREASEEDVECTSQCGSDCDGNHYIYDSEAEVDDDEDNEDYCSQHSDDELIHSEDESEQHECDSQCDHSDYEPSYMDGDDNEGSCYEGEDAEVSQGEIEWTCNSQCDSDCDGNHYVSGSDDEHFNDEDDSDVDNEPETENNNDTAHMDIPEPPPLMDTTSKPLTNGLNHVCIEIKEKLLPKPRQNHCIRSSSNTDVMSELKNAIDARVRRSASLHETTPNDWQEQTARKTSDPSEYLKKMDVGERETRRQERRKRLRTLELKREQLLDEVREGNEISTNQKLYVTPSIDT